MDALFDGPRLGEQGDIGEDGVEVSGAARDAAGEGGDVAEDCKVGGLADFFAAGALDVKIGLQLLVAGFIFNRNMKATADVGGVIGFENAPAAGDRSQVESLAGLRSSAGGGDDAG